MISNYKDKMPEKLIRRGDIHENLGHSPHSPSLDTAKKATGNGHPVLEKYPDATRVIAEMSYKILDRQFTKLADSVLIPEHEQIKEHLENIRPLGQDEGTLFYKAKEDIYDLNGEWNHILENPETSEAIRKNAIILAPATNLLMSKLNEVEQCIENKEESEAIKHWYILEKIANAPSIKDSISDWRKNYLITFEEIPQPYENEAGQKIADLSDEKAKKEIKKLISPDLLYTVRRDASTGQNKHKNKNEAKATDYKNLKDNCNRLLLFIDREDMAPGALSNLSNKYETNGKIDKIKSISAINAMHDNSPNITAKENSSISKLFNAIKTLKDSKRI